MNKQKVALVLSGGSAYGFAHIGVLKVLAKNNIPIDIIAGTSMGSLIGGIYSAGINFEQMEEVIKKFSRKHIVDINPFFLTDTGLLYGKKVTKFLTKLVGDKQIEDCNTKFCAIASDLKTGQKYVFERGLLVDAIRASISIPGIFKPVKYNNMCLVDGGMSDNIPVEDARRLGADKVITIDVGSYYTIQNKLKTAFDVLVTSLNLLSANFVALTKDKGDIYIKIDQPGVSIYKFTSEDALRSIEYGERYAEEALPQIKEMLGIN